MQSELLLIHFELKPINNQQNNTHRACLKI